MGPPRRDRRRCAVAPTCAYCGTPDPETRDHVPPRGIFADPPPPDLITVPCCARCHADTSADDEQFRNVLLSADNLENEPSPKQARHRVLRSIARPAGRRLWEDLLASMKDIDIVAGSGITLRRQPAFPVPPAVGRVVARIARGLFHRDFGTHLPPTHEVTRARLDQYGYLATRVAQTVGLSFPWTDRCPGEFTYVFRMMDDDPFSGVWMGRFFGRVFALAFFSQRGTSTVPHDPVSHSP